MKKITIKWLKSQGACEGGKNWVEVQKEKDPIKLIQIALKTEDTSWNDDEDILDYCNWGICRVFTRLECVRYAIYAAEKVIKIYEAKYPNDPRPREAIKAAKRYLRNPYKNNAAAANAAADAAIATNAAANAARATAIATNAAAIAAANAARAANAADAAAADADTKRELKNQILRYGIRILKERNK